MPEPTKPGLIGSGFFAANHLYAWKNNTYSLCETA